MSTNHPLKATATLLRKLKTLASQLQNDDPSLARYQALERVAQALGFENYDGAAHGHRKRAGETGEVDEPLSEQGQRLVDALGAMAGATSDENRYMNLRLDAINLWGSMADSGPQQQLYRVQREVAGQVELCRSYFEVVTVGIELPEQLRRFQHTGAVILNFEVEEWNGTAPVAKVDEGARRRLLKHLRANRDSKCDVRVSRLAVVTHASVRDVPSDRALFHAARSCFHVYDEFRAGSIPVDVQGERSATLGVIAMLSAPRDMWLGAGEFQRMLEDWAESLPHYEAEFLGAGDSRFAALGWGPSNLDLYLGDPAWKSIGKLDLPNPPGVQEGARTSYDPFVLRLRLDSETQRKTGLKVFDVAIAAKHLAARSNSFKHIGRTEAPAFCVGWCDLFLKSIRAAGEVSDVIVES